MKFATPKEALDFLASRIDEEGRLSQDPLSDRERKEVFAWEDNISESNTGSEDEPLTDEEMDEFISKVTYLSKLAYQRYRKTSLGAVRQWREAANVLKGSNQSLAMILYCPRSAGDIGLLILSALLLIGLMMLVFAGLKWVDEHIHLQFSDRAYVGVLLAIFLLLYYFTWSKSGKRLTDRIIGYLGDVADRVIGWF
jgi:hypothetical protein